jgi:cell division septation protein DedD
VIVALATLGFAGNQIRLSNATLADAQGGERVFTDLGWTLTLTLAELRSAQQAYVADGQDGEYWASQVAAHLEAVLGSLDNLKQVANTGSVAALDDAVATVGDIRDLDEEAREYTGSEQPLQASDLIFTRGLDLVDRATAHVQAALQAERTSRLDVMRTARAAQARMMWMAVAVVILSMLVLAPAGAASERDDPSLDPEEYHVSETSGLSLLSLDSDTADEELDLPAPDTAADADGPAADAAGTQPARKAPAPAATPDLGATAALCTDFGNVTNQDQLPDLLARTASLMNASGLVIWVNNENAGALQPILAHGYAPGTLERIGSIPQLGANPTSTAFATRCIQIVESAESDTGALAAPLMVSERCVGVLSAELRDGWQSSDAVRATASIVAAQLAPLLPADIQAAEPLPPAATGTHDPAGSAQGTETATPASS